MSNSPEGTMTSSEQSGQSRNSSPGRRSSSDPAADDNPDAQIDNATLMIAAAGHAERPLNRLRKVRGLHDSRRTISRRTFTDNN
jgi:hypothetical protein